MTDLPPYSREGTSQAAAGTMRAKAPPLREVIFGHYLARYPDGYTMDEVEALMGLPGNTIRPRICELRGKYGHRVRLVDSGVRRKTRSGRWAEVYVAVQQQGTLFEESKA